MYKFWVVSIALLNLVVPINVIAQIEVPCPDYFSSNTDWWQYQFEEYPDYSNHNCGPASVAMVLNFFKNKKVETSYEAAISPDYPDIHCRARWDYCQGSGHENGYFNSDWSLPGATTEQIQYVLGYEGIKSHLITGYDCLNDGTGINNLKNEINDGKLCICLVAPKYYREDVSKYFSHWTVAYGYDETHIYLNDPGYRTGRGFHANISQFADALWSVNELSTIIVIDGLYNPNSEFIEVSKGKAIDYPCLLESPDGKLHCVFTDSLELKYALSENQGATWDITNVPTPVNYDYGNGLPIERCQLAMDSRDNIFIIYNINTIEDPTGNYRKPDTYCSTNITGEWTYELVKEAWYKYSGYGFVKRYVPQFVVVDPSDKIHLFVRQSDWWMYGGALHELVRQDDGEWIDTEVAHIQTSDPDAISMITPNALVNDGNLFTLTFVNPGHKQGSGSSSLNLTEGTFNQSWENYSTKANDAKFSASAYDPQKNLHVTYISTNSQVLKYIQNWEKVSVIASVDAPFNILNPDIHIDANGKITITAITANAKTKKVTDIWYIYRDLGSETWHPKQSLTSTFDPSKFSLNPWLRRYEDTPFVPIVNSSAPSYYTSPKCVFIIDKGEKDRALVFSKLSKSLPSKIKQSKGALNDKSKTAILLSNYPNPFNSQTFISYHLDRTSLILIKIYNALGQEIRTVVNELQKEGDYLIKWDGTNDLNQAVPSGTYFCKISQSHHTESIKLVLKR